MWRTYTYTHTQHWIDIWTNCANDHMINLGRIIRESYTVSTMHTSDILNASVQIRSWMINIRHHILIPLNALHWNHLVRIDPQSCVAQNCMTLNLLDANLSYAVFFAFLWNWLVYITPFQSNQINYPYFRFRGNFILRVNNVGFLSSKRKYSS